MIHFILLSSFQTVIAKDEENFQHFSSLWNSSNTMKEELFNDSVELLKTCFLFISFLIRASNWFRCDEIHFPLQLFFLRFIFHAILMNSFFKRL